MSARMRLATTSSAVTLAALMMLGTTARLSASPIETPITYSTYGSVDGFGVDGPPILYFQGVPYSSLTTGSSFNLGKFAVAATPEAGSATYTNVPFHIAVRVQSVDGSAVNPNDTPVTLSGTLSAVLTDGQITSLNAHFAPPVALPGGAGPYPTWTNPFQLGSYMGYLSVDSTGDGGAPIQGTMNVSNVPEPTSILVFAAAGGFLALRARRTRS
jgi:hypothetical protein